MAAWPSVNKAPILQRDWQQQPYTYISARTDSMENTLKPSHSVLVLEDDPTVQLAYQKVVFKDLACTINLVGTGQAALAAVVTHAYDLIVLDYGLPDMTDA